MCNTQGPFDKKVSGLRLAHQDRQCAFSIGRGSKNWPEPSKPKQNQGSRQGGPRPQLGPAAAPSCTSAAALADLTRWHAKTAYLQFLSCFTAKTGLNPRKPKQHQGFRQGGPRPPTWPCGTRGQLGTQGRLDRQCQLGTQGQLDTQGTLHRSFRRHGLVR